jgi:hypothetical protein
MSKKDKNLGQASVVEKQYKEGLAYKNQMGFLKKWAEYERFKAGDQWPAVTEKTKMLPRPVFNIIKQIINHKVASVMNENIKMVFSANDVEEGSIEFEAADKFTRYSETTWENVKQDQLNEEALESGGTNGPCIWHYFWDTSKKGGNRLKYVGGIAGEIIDPVNFFPGNPQNHKVQEQPYLIITHRDLVESVREQARQNGVSNEMANLIKSDSDTEDQAYDMAKRELSEDNKVTVLTKYWKELQVPAVRPTVHFIKVAGNVVVKEKTNTRLTLYPVAVMQWERRKRSIFGVGDTEALIPNQKAINFLLAMQLLSVQLTGWPKLAVDKNFIKQQITNTPGEVINVTGINGSIGNAIQYLNPGNISAHSANLVDSFMSYTKEVAGANENALGEQSSAQMNATAIMLLQKASGVPLESIKRRFYQAMEDVGLIWAEFWKVYYNTNRMVPLKDDDGEVYTETFNGSQFADVDMNLKIDIGPSSSYSESLMMTSLDKLFDGQHITLEDYLQFVPKNVVPFKDRLLKKVQERQEQQQMMMAQQQTDFDMMLQQLPPEERQAFLAAPPDVQEKVRAQMLGQQPQTPMM